MVGEEDSSVFVTKHYLRTFRSSYDHHILILCTECNDILDCGLAYGVEAKKAVYQNIRLFQTIHAQGKPKFFGQPVDMKKIENKEDGEFVDL